jgi:hypothetical protein
MTKLLTKKQMLDAGRVFNYYSTMDEYLDIMPFNSKERSEVKLALTTKIEYAFARDDKATYKVLDKRMKELRKEIKKRKKNIKKVEDMVDQNFIKSINMKLQHS